MWLSIGMAREALLSDRGHVGTLGTGSISLSSYLIYLPIYLGQVTTGSAIS